MTFKILNLHIYSPNLTVMNIFLQIYDFIVVIKKNNTLLPFTLHCY